MSCDWRSGGKERTKYLRCVVCIEEIDDIKVEVLLKPYDVAFSTMQNLPMMMLLAQSPGAYGAHMPLQSEGP